MVSPGQQKRAALPAATVHCVILLIIGVMLLAAYWKGLNGPFLLDDEENITGNPSIALQNLSLHGLRAAFFANGEGLLGRPLASLSFAINYYLAGSFASPGIFKVTNLAIHFTNACLLYVLVLALARSPVLHDRLPGDSHIRVAALTAALWAIHPLQLTSVLYVVQRMTSLSALVVLLTLIGFVHARLRFAAGNQKFIFVMTGCLIIGTGVGIGTKENAALIPLFALVIEATLFSRHLLLPSHRRALVIQYLLVTIVPALLFVLVVLSTPGYLESSYLSRTYSALERLLTETRVLWQYIGQFVLPHPQRLSLFHDDIPISRSLVTPISTIVATMALVASASGAWLVRQRAPVLSFGVLWFLAGHMLESTVFDLEIAFEHRNYVPTMGLAFALAHFLGQTLPTMTRTPLLPRLLVVCAVVSLFWGTLVRAGSWSDTFTLAMSEAHNRPLSVRANDFAARVSARDLQDLPKAISYQIRAVAADLTEPGTRITLRLYAALLDYQNKQSNRTGGSIAGTQGAVPKLNPDPTTEPASRVAVAFDEYINDREIARLLRSSAVTIHTTIALEDLRGCVIDAADVCANLRAPAMSWFEIAQNHPRAAPHHRAMMARARALVVARYGSHGGPTKLELIDQAIQNDPGNLLYGLDKVEFLEQAGQSRDAQSVLTSLLDSRAPGDPDLAYHRARIDQLEKKLR